MGVSRCAPTHADGRIAIPYGRIAMPYGRIAIPYGRIAMRPYLRGTEP